MPWKTTTPMEEALRFVTLAQTERFTLTELFSQFCISRVVRVGGRAYDLARDSQCSEHVAVANPAAPPHLFKP
jgi:hypothetical protein